MPLKTLMIGTNGSETEGDKTDLGTLQRAVGGFIETVPGFSTIVHAGAKHYCVAYCNEEGKLKNLPLNDKATAHWHRCLGSGSWDVLVGNVIVVYGDPAELEKL